METTQLFRNLPEFYHKWAPLTWCIGFLEAPPQLIESMILPWMKKTNGRIAIRHAEGDGNAIFPQLLPLTGATRKMWCTTKSEWIAFVDNGLHGSSAQAPISYLPMVLGCRGIVATCIPRTIIGSGKTARGAHGAVQLEIYGSEFRAGAGANYIRSISAAKDAGRSWRLYESGNRLPFEEVEKYSAPDAWDRFTPDMLSRYCEHFGIRLYDPDFYGTEAQIWDFLDWPQSKQWSLEEAKEHLRINNLSRGSGIATNQ